MKKITFVLVFMTAFLSLSLFKPMNEAKAVSVTTIDVKATIYVDAELRNDDYGQVLCLYNDGTCVIRTGEGRGTGTYNINRGQIFITWDNGTKQQGNAIFDDGQLKSVTIEGLTYSRRLVKNRR